MTDLHTENPLLIKQGLPAYDRIQPAHIGPAVDTLLERCRSILRSVENNSEVSWAALMEPLEEVDLLFEYGWSPVGHLLSVANSDELRAAHDEAMPKIVEFSLELRQSEVLYQKMLALKASPEWNSFSSAQQRILTRMIQSAEQSGISLKGKDRDRFNEIEQELSQLGTDYSNNLLDATKAFFMDLTDPADADGFPASLRRITAASWSRADENKDKPPATPENGPWRITLDQPSFGPFMEHCRNRDLREQLYRAYIMRAGSGKTDNSPLITQILKLKKEQAALLGFESYADLSLSRKMAGDVAAVQQMFDRLLAASHHVAKKELEELTEFAQQNGHTGRWLIGMWPSTPNACENKSMHSPMNNCGHTFRWIESSTDSSNCATKSSASPCKPQTERRRSGIRTFATTRSSTNRISRLPGSIWIRTHAPKINAAEPG